MPVSQRQRKNRKTPLMRKSDITRRKFRQIQNGSLSRYIPMRALPAQTQKSVRDLTEWLRMPLPGKSTSFSPSPSAVSHEIRLTAWSPSGSSRRKVWRCFSRRRIFTPLMPRANCCSQSCPHLHKKKQGRFRRTPHGVEESPLRTERSASVIPISSVTTKDPTGSL